MMSSMEHFLSIIPCLQTSWYLLHNYILFIGVYSKFLWLPPKKENSIDAYPYTCMIFNVLKKIDIVHILVMH